MPTIMDISTWHGLATSRHSRRRLGMESEVALGHATGNSPIVSTRIPVGPDWLHVNGFVSLRRSREQYRGVMMMILHPSNNRGRCFLESYRGQYDKSLWNCLIFFLCGDRRFR